MFELPKAEREKTFNQENLTFLKTFVTMEMNSYSLPDIDNAQDFSEVIEVLRLNYRQWNQQLMYLMRAAYEFRSIEAQSDLTEFIKSCPWNMLVEVGRTTPE
ncbi:MAG: hypothetical protein WA071_14445 [Undibacterium umbellatum]|uniref:hypothetical protein n=1 Tax=Undibacterium umbellatum TaxID=2762300 RepID=UPI003BB7202F